MSDLTALTGADTSGSTEVQGTQRHGHHHHMSIADQVSQLGSAIDNAVKAGTMTSDQATTLKKELADITTILGQATQAAGNGTTNTSATATTTQTNPLAQLSDADKQKIFGELRDVRQQLYAANNPQGTGAASGASSNNNAIANLFSEIDTDHNGTIDQNEFTRFLAQIGANALGYNANATSNIQAASSAFSAIA